MFYATGLVASYSTPMVPRAATLDRKWNEAANSYFDEWAERADFTGRFDFWDLQRLGSFYLDTDGEVFALWADEAGSPQIQLLESWRIDKPTVADDRILDGVRIDTQTGAAALVLGSRLDIDLTSRFEFITQLRAQITRWKVGETSYHSLLHLEFKTHNRLDPDLSRSWDRIAAPRTYALGIMLLRDDFRLTTGLGIEL